MRAAVNLEQIGSRSLWVDCDVLQADGGTRTAAITGAFVALQLALRKLLQENKLPQEPTVQPVAGVSVGVVDGQPVLDLCYEEDVAADVDMNLVMTRAGEFVELQGTGEQSTFNRAQLESMLALGKIGMQSLFVAQAQALS
jgi:ribonuclease PH